MQDTQIQDTQPVDIHAAVEQQNVEAVKRFIKEQPDVIDTLDANGNTPLHLAAKNGNYVIAEFLIRAGALIDPRNSVGETPLFNASFNDNFKLVKLLVECGADVNCFLTDGEFKGMSVLHAAIRNSNFQMIEYLVLNNARVNINPEGERFTPIMMAITKNKLKTSDNKVKIIQYLLGVGADMEQPNYFGVRLIDMDLSGYIEYKAYQDQLLAAKNATHAAASEEKSKNTSAEHVTTTTTDENAVITTTTGVNLHDTGVVAASETIAIDYEHTTAATTNDVAEDNVNNNTVTQPQFMNNQPAPIANNVVDETPNFGQWANMFSSAATTKLIAPLTQMNETQQQEQVHEPENRNSIAPTFSRS